MEKPPAAAARPPRMISAKQLTAFVARLFKAAGLADKAAARIAELTGLPFVSAPNKFAALAAHDAIVFASGALVTLAASLMKIANDVRWLGSGPRAGLGEINLPAMQAGSSIMPGKVNPVIPEVVNQIAFEVIGNDLTVSFAAEAGQLQLNAFEPVIAHSLFKSVTHLRQGCMILAEFRVHGPGRLRVVIDRSSDRQSLLLKRGASRCQLDWLCCLSRTADRTNCDDEFREGKISVPGAAWPGTS